MSVSSCRSRRLALDGIIVGRSRIPDTAARDDRCLTKPSASSDSGRTWPSGCCVAGRRVDDDAHLVDEVDREPGEAGVLADGSRVVGEGEAEYIVVGGVTLLHST